MMDGFEITRTMDPETDSVRYKLTYTASIEGYVGMEALLELGYAAENAMKNELSEALVHEIYLSMQAARK